MTGGVRNHGATGVANSPLLDASYWCSPPMEIHDHPSSIITKEKQILLTHDHPLLLWKPIDKPSLYPLVNSHNYGTSP